MLLNFSAFPLAGWRGFEQIPRPRGGICPSFHYWDNFNSKRGNYIHGAIDMFANLGTYIVSVDSGKVVTFKGTDYPLDDNGGYNVTILSNNVIYYYAHMLEHPLVKPGDIVRAGQLIGQVGQSGNATKSCPHLHLQCYARTKNNTKGRLLNPYARLKELENTALPDFKPEQGILIPGRDRNNIVPLILIGSILLSLS